MDPFLHFFKKIIPRQVFKTLQPVYHFFLSWWAALFYGFPSRKLFVIGVTGTKGKTTVVELLHEILKESGAGVASISSLRFRVFVQKFLHKAVRAGCRYVILEVTSEGIKQYRHRFIRFDVAVMTNVAPEHIEAHGSFENYLRAKLDLFWRLPKDGLAVLNRDDTHAVRFRAATAAHILWYGKEGVGANGKIWSVRDLLVAEGGIVFDLNDTEIRSGLRGEFNFYNITAAVSVGLNQHVSFERIVSAVARVKEIPGRFEYVQREPFAVVVDYAHTPDSLRAVYGTLREQNAKHKFQDIKMICVFGATGGGRDKWKRPEYGKIASEFCDKIFLTDEDSYDENTDQILSEIESGVTDDKKQATEKILDRREAIYEALKLAKPGDVVICTGKGAEPWIVGPNGTKQPWDERVVVREELQRLSPDVV
jgi:UDP-N-acetylmuramoyl-L-alanyl-D-glutamate--2,6-diaminopimelate ligase